MKRPSRWVDSNAFSNTVGSNKGANGDLVKRDLISQYHERVKNIIEDLITHYMVMM